MLPETPDPTLPLFAEIASLKSALAAVQDARSGIGQLRLPDRQYQRS
jgi:hypothetical protein